MNPESRIRGEAKLVSLATGPKDDAFGRLRVSSLNTHVDIKNVGAANTSQVDEETNGTGSSSHNANDSSVSMNVAANNDHVIRQSRHRSVHQAGKSMTGTFTFGSFHPETDVVKRVGLFESSTSTPFNSDLDGLYFESSEGKIWVVKAKKGEDPVRVERSEWNIDRLDGFGLWSSSLNGRAIEDAEFEKAMLGVIDYAWLGVGIVRFGFMIAGEFVVVHQFEHVFELDGPFMRSPSKPIRYEIRSTGGSGSLKQICAAVGGETSDAELLGEQNSIRQDTGVTSVSGSSHCLIALRLKSGFEHVSLVPFLVSVLCDAAADFNWFLSVNPTLSSGIFSFTQLTGTGVEYDIGTGHTFSDVGRIVATGYANRYANTMSEIAPRLSALGRTIQGEGDVLVLGIKTSAVQLFKGSISFKEIG